MVFTSSREVYGDPDQLPVPESASLRPKNAYGASKVAGEAYCQAFGNDGLETVILRLANVYGPRDRDRVIPLFVENALRVINYHTLSDFRTEHQEALHQLFVEVLGVLDQAELVSLGPVMHDGMKVKANAADNSFRRPATLEQHLEVARQHVEQMEREESEEVSPRQQAARQRAAREKQQRLEQALAELKQIQAAQQRARQSAVQPNRPGGPDDAAGAGCQRSRLQRADLDRWPGEDHRGRGSEPMLQRRRRAGAGGGTGRSQPGTAGGGNGGGRGIHQPGND